MSTTELREKRARLAEQGRQLVNKSIEEKRAMTAEEESAFAAIHGDVETCTRNIEIRERQAHVDQLLAEAVPRASAPPPIGVPPHALAIQPPMHPADEQRELLRAWLLAGSDKPRLPEHEQLALRNQFDLGNRQMHLRLSRVPMTDFRSWEYRAQATTPGGSGGFTIQDEMMRPLEVALLQFGGMRAVATILRTSTGADLPIPMSNDTANKGVRLAENTVVAQQDVAFTQLILQAYKYSSKMVLCSVEFLQDSAVDIPGFLGRALGERIGRILNDELTVGTGVSMPMGIIPAATVGVTGPTGTATSVTYNNLVDLEHSVDPAYRTGARFMFHDSTLAAIKKLVDTQGRPLWMENIRVSEPPTILGYPYVINQSMAVMAANAKSIVFGDLSKYIIRDVLDVTILRLDERFADFHQVAFLAFSRHDGDLLDAGTRPVKVFVNSAT